MNKRDRATLDNWCRGWETAPWLLIGETRMAIVRHHVMQDGPNDVWPTGEYWYVSYANRDRNGGGGGGYATEAEAVAAAEHATGVDAVQQGVLALERELRS